MYWGKLPEMEQIWSIHRIRDSLVARAAPDAAPWQESLSPLPGVLPHEMCLSGAGERHSPGAGDGTGIPSWWDSAFFTGLHCNPWPHLCLIRSLPRDGLGFFSVFHGTLLFFNAVMDCFQKKADLKVTQWSHFQKPRRALVQPHSLSHALLLFHWGPGCQGEGVGAAPLTSIYLHDRKAMPSRHSAYKSAI